MTFLAMVVLIMGVDLAISFVTNSKIKWIEMPIFVELLGVMLYVILGLSVGGIWHPSWLMCLAGVLVGVVEFAVFVSKKMRAKNAQESKKLHVQNDVQDEKYWTQWDD